MTADEAMDRLRDLQCWDDPEYAREVAIGVLAEHRGDPDVEEVFDDTMEVLFP